MFLENSRCFIRDARPFACRTYPITIGPGKTADTLDYYLCTERKHHFTGRKWSVDDWLVENLDEEDLVFIKLEYSYAHMLGKHFRRLNSSQFQQALFPLVLYKYYEFDVGEPFLPQYVRNIEKLMAAIERL